jgi:hypothetical protein
MTDEAMSPLRWRPSSDARLRYLPGRPLLMKSYRCKRDRSIWLIAVIRTNSLRLRNQRSVVFGPSL